MTNAKPSGFVQDVWGSFTALPLWVILWMVLILAPLNMASLAFLEQPGGWTVAVLCWAGMVGTMIPVAIERGFSKASSFGHVLCWTALVAFLIFARPEADGLFNIYLWALLVVNCLSLAFDYLDAARWLWGEREVLRAKPARR